MPRAACSGPATVGRGRWPRAAPRGARSACRAMARARRRQTSASTGRRWRPRQQDSTPFSRMQLGLVHPLIGLLHLLQRLAKHLQSPVHVTRPPVQRRPRGPCTRATRYSVPVARTADSASSQVRRTLAARPRPRRPASRRQISRPLREMGERVLGSELPARTRPPTRSKRGPIPQEEGRPAPPSAGSRPASRGAPPAASASMASRRRARASVGIAEQQQVAEQEGQDAWRMARR